MMGIYRKKKSLFGNLNLSLYVKKLVYVNYYIVTLLKYYVYSNIILYISVFR